MQSKTYLYAGKIQNFDALPLKYYGDYCFRWPVSVAPNISPSETNLQFTYPHKPLPFTFPIQILHAFLICPTHTICFAPIFLLFTSKYFPQHPFQMPATLSLLWYDREVWKLHTKLYLCWMPFQKSDVHTTNIFYHFKYLLDSSH